jgi:SAM-dependent methyltransferase
MYEYDEVFYNYINRGAISSARALLPPLISALPCKIESVLDVGCGAGAWLSVWKSMGADITGLDGDYVRNDQLLIDTEEFIAADLRNSFSLQKKFTLAQCLEVAEHLPSTAAAGVVESLCQHADLVLFSAATPGQGGENHINEQPISYWRALFETQGYALYDPVRPVVSGNSTVKSWYRYNTFLYVNEECPEHIKEGLARHRVASQQRPKNFEPLLYRARKQLIRVLPDQISTLMAIVKKNLFKLSFKLRRNE